MTILVDKRFQDLRMEEVSDMVGFANRQSFYASFYRVMGMTPRDYRMQHLLQHPAMKKSETKRGRKPKTEKKTEKK
jgi:AraC-like DNA-binding protein